MFSQEWTPSERQSTLAFQAMFLAYVTKASFTAEAFCKRYGHRLNRHSRKVLNEMVRVGALAKHKTLYDDGHYRMVYCAQKTARGSAT